MMSEPKPASKNKNKKKKTKMNMHTEAPATIDVGGICPNSVKLPQSVSESTFINEVQVTLAEKKEAAQETKKKKNKGSKKSPSDVKLKQPNQNMHGSPNPANHVNDAANVEPPLLSFSRGGNVELKHLPEITVTRTNETKITSPQSPNDVSKEPVVNDIPDTSTAKKKKKKKKKNKSSNQENNAENNDSPTSEPTYVKLPATGDACVLVVSHENFGNSDTSSKKNSSTIGNCSSTEANSMPNTSLISCSKNTFSTSQVAMAPTPVMKADIPLEVSKGPSVSIIPINTSDSPHDKSYDNDKNVTMKSGMAETNTGTDSKSMKLTEVAKDALNSKAKVAADKHDNQKATKGPKKSPSSQESAKTSSEKTVKVKAPVKEAKPSQVRLFAHLPQYKPYSVVSKHLESKSDIHPAIVAVGAQCAEGIISGSSSRCVAVLAALKEVIRDYETPPNKELSRDLEAKCQTCINFISKCRPLSVSMCNAVKVMKHYITSIPSDISDDEAKQLLYSQISKFINEEICLAKKAISCYITDKIVDGDVILIYAYSSVVRDALCQAHEEKKSFRVIVVDSRPKMEGRQMLKCLLKQGIMCSYVLINGIYYVMKEVNKVIIGAHALQANGYVMSRVGASQIALVASFYNVPFLVCCETYKFCERVHTDSFVYNELGDPESFIKTDNDNTDGVLKTYKDLEKLQLLNLLYDITPPHLVSMVITEKGMLPCTSVPVVLRVRHSGTHD